MGGRAARYHGRGNRCAVILAAFRESDVIFYEEGAVAGFAAMFDGQLRVLFVPA